MLLTYSYSFSDPIIQHMRSGDIVRHGTAEGGGFGLSLTGWGANDGLVVYWLQKPGGMIFVRTREGFDEFEFRGKPTEFKNAVLAKMGRPVDIWFGDSDPEGILESVSLIYDKDGNPGFAVANHGDAVTISALNVDTEFAAGATISLQRETPAMAMATESTRITLNEDGNSGLFEILEEGRATGQLQLDADRLDALIAHIGSVRSRMSPQIAAEPKLPSGSQREVINDPAWRTRSKLHPSINGVLLQLRHTHFGWVWFLLPQHEAMALGKWLMDHAGTE